MQIPSSLNLKQFFNLNSDNKTERKSLYLGDRPPLESLWPKSSSQSGSSSRKAAAAAKIAELKMRLEAMLKFAGIGKGNPAAAISLAKELAAAVRAYGGSSGGGGDSAVSVPQLSASGSTDSTDSKVAAAPTDSTATAAGDATSSAAVAAAASTAASVTSAAFTATSVTNTKGGEISSASGDAKAASATAAQAQMATSPSMKLDSANGLSAGDSQFLADAKSLMQQIKMLIKLEAKKAEDEKKAQSAINEMTQALEDAPAAIAQSNLADASTEYTAAGESVAGATEASTVSISV